MMLSCVNVCMCVMKEGCWSIRLRVFEKIGHLKQNFVLIIMVRVALRATQ